MRFRVGDRVVYRHSDMGNVSAGTIKSITPKQKDIVVDFGTFKRTFRPDGELKNNETSWFEGKILPITPKIERELTERSTIQKCRTLLENRISYDEAVQIIDILEGKER